MVSQSHAIPVLITRPEPQAARFVHSLQARYGDRITCVLSPVLAPTIYHPPLPDQKFNAVVLTSETGARAAAESRAALPSLAFCVGDQTARVAEELGFDARSAGGDAEALYSLLLDQKSCAPFLHLRGRETRGDLVARLAQAAIPASDLVVYAQEPVALTPDAVRLLTGHTMVVVPLFSPRSAEVFCRALHQLGLPFDLDGRLCVAAISPAVATYFSSLPPSRLCVAMKPTQAELISALDRFVFTA